MSQFVLLFRSTNAEAKNAMGTPEAAQKSMQAWLAWIRHLETRGHLKSPGQPLERSGRVVRSRPGGSPLVTDGPFVEAKDLVLGFIVIEATDLAEATKLSAGCPMLAGEASVEVRPVAEFSS
jgi:hypothetical protein